MSCLNPTHDSVQKIARPVVAVALSTAAGRPCEPHSHSRAQLLYSISGTMTVITANTSWMITPQRAVWIPPGVIHQAAAHGLLELRTLYIIPAAIPKSAPHHPQVIRVSPLLRELVDRVTTLASEYEEDGRDGRIVQMLLEELDWSPVNAFELPVLTDPRLLRLQRLLTEDPASARTLDDWALIVGAASRTLTRLLLREAGMPFRIWRENLRVHLALPSLIEGKPVSTVALDLGYQSLSAFAVMFRRVMGVNPSEYMSARPKA